MLLGAAEVPPPSLQNIFKGSRPTWASRAPDTAALDAWARQGVLLLNASLTVRAGRAASHQGRAGDLHRRGAAPVNAKPERVVFILWGASARRKKP